MTRLVGAVPDSERFRLRGAGIPDAGVTYTTRAAAEEAASVFRDHLIGAEVVPVDNPKFPTPWRVENESGDIYDANGAQVAETLFFSTTGHFVELAQLIVDAVNEKYGEESPLAEPKPGDRVRVVECCPGNTEAGCTSLVGETGVLKAVSDTKRVPYYVRFDSGGYETVHNVARV